MLVDLRILDERIKELQYVRRFLSNPENAFLMDPATLKMPIRQASQKRLNPRHGLRYETLRVLQSAQNTGSEKNALTAREIVEKLEAEKYKFAAKDRRESVQATLRELEKRGLVSRSGVVEDTGAVLWRTVK